MLNTIGRIGVEGAHYKVMEFSGPVIEGLGLDDRLSMTNMAIEAGGKTGVVEPDENTIKYLKQIQGKRFSFKGSLKEFKSDRDARYKVIEIDVQSLNRKLPARIYRTTPKQSASLRMSASTRWLSVHAQMGGLPTWERQNFKNKKVKSGLGRLFCPQARIFISRHKKEALSKF